MPGEAPKFAVVSLQQAVKQENLLLAMM